MWVNQNSHGWVWPGSSSGWAAWISQERHLVLSGGQRRFASLERRLQDSAWWWSREGSLIVEDFEVDAFGGLGACGVCEGQV